MNFKRFMASLLAVCLLVCAMPALAEETAEEYQPEEEIEVAVEDMVSVDDLKANGTLDDKGWWNILLLGGDSRSDNGAYGRTDAIIILSVNPEQNKVKLASIMRDSWIEIYGCGSNRINAANRYGGPELVMRTINENFDMNLSDYVLVGMEAFKEIVDILGGVELNIKENELYRINEQQYYNLREMHQKTEYDKLTEFGENTLCDGNQALAYVRLRHGDGDAVRTGRQRDALVALAKKLQTEGNITTIASVVLTLLGYVETNLTLGELLQLCGVGFALDMNEVDQLRLPVDGAYRSEKINGASVITLDYPKNAEYLYNYIYNDINPQAEE